MAEHTAPDGSYYRAHLADQEAADDWLREVRRRTEDVAAWHCHLKGRCVCRPGVPHKCPNWVRA